MTDSQLEEDGFEPSVPRDTASTFPVRRKPLIPTAPAGSGANSGANGMARRPTAGLIT